jgi:hypothetical protein
MLPFKLVHDGGEGDGMGAVGGAAETRRDWSFVYPTAPIGNLGGEDMEDYSLACVIQESQKA